MTSFIDKDDIFNAMIDLHHFKPEEITVKVVDRYMIIEAKHEKKGDEYDSICRQFTKTYRLLDDTDIDQITSTISSDGILIVNVPVKSMKPKEPTDERTREQENKRREIKIELTGQPAVRPDDIIDTSVSEESEEYEELTTKYREII